MTASLASRLGNLVKNNTYPAVIATAVHTALGRTTYQPIPLNNKYPTPEEITPQTYADCETQISTLANGMKVVSRVTNDPIVNLGLYINAGSRYCTPDTSGIGHFMEGTVIEGTWNINAQRMQENLARTGSSLGVQAFRDATMYQIETFKKHSDFALETLAELIWNPRIEDHRLKKLKQEYLWRRGDHMKEHETEIPEYFHQAAYQGNTIGLPMFCDHNTINNISRETLEEYVDVFYQPSRMTCVGVGIEHSELERLADQVFGDRENDPRYIGLEHPQAQYTGGQLKMRYDFEKNTNTHVGLIFETENWKSPDLMALCVLNMIMGGGGSFSAGGPGKGMYTRLYREVLGTHHWVEHISCSHSVFDDTGIFVMYACAPPENAGELTSVMLREVLNMAVRSPTTVELDRAKKSLASNICFEFENRQIVFEDLARQVQVYGSHRSPEMWREDIMKVTAEDVVRVAKNLLKSKPTILGIGPDVSLVPSNEEISEAIQKVIPA
jgi:processing peptidase subunit alpha